MYHHLRGQLHELKPASAVVEAGGVGYDLRIPLSTFERLKGKKEVCLFTHLLVREDDMRLFGFATTGERELFRMLLSVSGVGPTIAIQALSAFAPSELMSALSTEDLKTIQEIKGVGRKLAERLVVELRDKVGPMHAALGLSPEPSKDRSSGAPAPSDPLLLQSEVADAVLALVSLGFDRKSAESLAVAKARANPPERLLTTETLIKDCLRSR